MKQKIAQFWETVRDYLPSGGIAKLAVAALGVYLLLTLSTGMYWSLLPAAFDVQQMAKHYGSDDGSDLVTGSVTTAALMGVMETLLDKPGGLLYNDRFPPGVWLDNIPNWEYGALIQVRDLARALREVHARSQSQSREDPDLAQAEPLYNFSVDSWILPASESEYRKALEHTHNYFQRLSDVEAAEAQFYARADNLHYWLSTVESRLGSLSQRLSASVGTLRVNTDLAGEETASQATQAPGELEIKTPWMEIDDVFYEARGTAWALTQFLKAADQDFADVLRKKNAQISLRQIIRELEGAQQAIFSPMILNGSGFGLLANHSLVMASYLSRANAALIDLRDLLTRG